MRALKFTAYGSPEFLRLGEVDKPVPEAGEVLIAVQAASVNSWDYELVEGRAMSRMGSPFKPAHPILGADFAGIVIEVGAGVTALKPGDRVFGDLSNHGWGGFAEYVTGPENAFALLPGGVDFVTASALPQAGTLALQAIDLFPQLAKGHRVLIKGGGGGVGHFAIQMGKRKGAHVTAIDRAHKLDFMRDMGADEAYDFRTYDPVKAGKRYDLIIDPVTEHPGALVKHCLTDGGLLVVIGGSVGGLLSMLPLMGMDKLRGQRRATLLIWRPDVQQFSDLAERVLAGDLKVHVDQVFPLEQGAQAVRKTADGAALGKIVVSPVVQAR